MVQSYADRNGLEIDWSDPAATVSKLAVITQTPKEFDLPIPHLAPQFYYAGPFRDDEGREPIPFPWEKLTGKPLIYASLGTLVNGLNSLYRTILEAVSRFPDTQVVLLTAGDLTELITRVSSNPRYRDKARWFQKILKQTRGLDVAADIVERAFEVSQERPVTLAEASG